MHERPDRSDRIADDRETLDRTRFLQRATLLVGAVTTAIVAVPAATMAVAPGLHTGTYYNVDLGPVANFPADDASPYHVVTFESVPHDSTAIDRRVAFVRNDGEGT